MGALLALGTMAGTMAGAMAGALLAHLRFDWADEPPLLLPLLILDTSTGAIAGREVHDALVRRLESVDCFGRGIDDLGVSAPETASSEGELRKVA